jgi:hypothetical protein
MYAWTILLGFNKKKIDESFLEIKNIIRMIANSFFDDLTTSSERIGKYCSIRLLAK